MNATQALEHIHSLWHDKKIGQLTKEEKKLLNDFITFAVKQGLVEASEANYIPN